MEGLNKIRISNISYANGERYYDDLILDVGTKTLALDYINGGGKTFLAQCAMQAILPKSHFTAKHPFKELYKKENNNTIHSLMEWKLGEGSEFDYMITGFCSRKKEQKKAVLGDSEDSMDNFNTFNYVCFYNEGSKYSIDKIPLKITKESGAIERMSYSELRSYLRKLNSEEIGEPYYAKIFDSTTEYHKLLNDYKINKSEWDMMRELNKKEANAEEYFNRYPTAKSFIRDFLVAKIDEANKINNIADYQSGDDRAESLLSIRNTIVEYSKRIDSVKELDYIENVLESIVSLNEDLLKLYSHRDDIKLKIVKGYNKVNSDIEQKAHDIEVIDTKIDELERNKEEYEYSKSHYYDEINTLEEEIKEYKLLKKEMSMYKSALVIKDKEHDAEIIAQNLDNIKVVVEEKNQILNDLKKQKDRYLAEDKYVDFLKENITLRKHEETKESQEKSNAELIEKLNKDGGIYKGLLKENIDNLIGAKEDVHIDIDELKNNISTLNIKRDDLKAMVSKDTTTIENNSKEIAKLEKELVDTIRKAMDVLNIYVEAESKINKEFIKFADVDFAINNNTHDVDNGLIADVVGALNNVKDEVTKYIDFICSDVAGLRGNLDKIATSMNEIVDIDADDFTDLDKLTLVNGQFEGINIYNRSDFNRYKDSIVNKIQCKKNEALDIYEANINKLKDNLEALEIKLTTLSEKKKYKTSDIEKCKHDIEALVNEATEYTTILNDKKFLMEKYNANNLYVLEDVLDCQIRTAEYDIKDKEKLLKELEDELERLEANEGIVVSREIINCYNMLKSKFDNVLLGLDFINMATQEEKEMYLDKTDSLIAYSILLPNSEYDKVIKNENLLKHFKDSLIPIINIDKLREDNISIGDGLYISHRCKSEILDEDKVAKLIEEKTQEVINFKIGLNESVEHLKTLKADYTSVIEFTRKYNEDFVTENMLKQEQSNEQMVVLEEKVTSIIEEIKYNTTEKESIVANINSLEHLKSNVKSVDSIINKVAGILDACNAIHSEIAGYADKVNDGVDKFKKIVIDKKDLHVVNAEKHEVIDRAKKEIDTVDKSITENDNSMMELLSKIATIDSKLDQANQEISKLNYDIIEDNSNITLLIAKEIFENTQKSIGGKLADLNIINDAIVDVKERIKCLEADIKRSGFALEDFDDSITDKHTQLEYNNLDVKIGNAETELKDTEQSFNKEKDNLTGIKAVIASLIDALQRKYKIKYININIPQIDVNAELVDIENNIETNEYEIDNNRDEISTIDNEIKNVSKEISNVQRDRNKLKDVEVGLKSTLSSLENLIENEKIDINMSRDIADDIEYVVKKAKKELDVNRNKLTNTEYKHISKIDSTKTYLANSTFNFVEDLNEIYCPKSAEECQNQIDSIKGDYGYMYLLSEEKNTLASEIEELQQYQENFIALCVQRCNYVLDKMMEIEEFSKIDIGEEKKSTIQVILNPLPEDERKIKMRNYITNIINDVNGVEINESKVKEIGKALELKNLFPQILTDINKCRIQIFKINETCDGGQFIDWGEAGSTGQTNAMSLYLFMCTLVFVRRLSSFSVKEDSRKFLLLDSPFNGTVALNLWKIPLEIMKKNNIQVMVLGYQIPPQLTGMFDKRIAFREVIVNNGGKNVKVIKEDVLASREDALTPNDIIYGQDKGNVFNMES